MALTKRGKTWHCHFVVNGQRFRQSLQTTDWREAQAKEKELIAAASEGKLHQTSTTLAVSRSDWRQTITCRPEVGTGPGSKPRKSNCWYSCGPTSNRNQ